MTCPYCGLSSCVELVGVPTVARLIALAPALGLGVLGVAATAALVATYSVTGKCIYKCTRCNKYFIA